MNRHLILVALMAGVVAAIATEFTFVPNDKNGDPDDVWDLDHNYWYTWGFKNFALPEGETITEAVLTIRNVNNWTAAENGQNWLRLYLLDTAENPYNGRWDQGNPPAGRLRRYADADNGTDNISGLAWTAKVHIGTYTDHDGGPGGDEVTLVYSFGALGMLDELEAYIANGNDFGLAFDPDCHYWNDGVLFTLTTGARHVPDGGSTVWLMAFGVGTAAWAGRRRSA